MRPDPEALIVLVLFRDNAGAAKTKSEQGDQARVTALDPGSENRIPKTPGNRTTGAATGHGEIRRFDIILSKSYHLIVYDFALSLKHCF